MRIMSASPVGNFYIYSFDGKLLQLYNVYGTLLKDYIYMGDRLIAEYDHVGARFLYYTPDQINTTRVVTDQSGNVVYSVVHDPYGGIQQTSPGNTFDPQLKFSGKEHDTESGLDYFGARYYDRAQYRFISVDPITALMPTRLISQANLYSYCGNNPIAFFDPDGKAYLTFSYGSSRMWLFMDNGICVAEFRAANNVPISTFDADIFSSAAVILTSSRPVPQTKKGNITLPPSLNQRLSSSFWSRSVFWLSVAISLSLPSH